MFTRMNKSLILFSIQLALCGMVSAQISLEAPSKVPAGATVTIKWSGSPDKSDYLTIVTPDKDDRAYEDYIYLTEGNDLQLPAPIFPGEYELRCNRESQGTVLARHKMTVTPVSATLQAPATAELASTIAITWEGPNYPGDYVTIVPKGAGPTEWGLYRLVSEGKTLELEVPDKPGSYEIRYAHGKTYRSLGSIPLEVGSVSVTINAPEQVPAGGPFDVSWEGGVGKRDYLTILPEGTPDGEWGDYKNVADGMPATFTAPSKPGAYEIRYNTDASHNTLARKRIEVTDTTASLTVPTEVEADTEFQVKWQGPDNPSDYLMIRESGKDDDSYLTYVSTASGNPATFRAPFKGGDYLISYHLGKGNRKLAEAPVKVKAVNRPGKLRVSQQQQHAVTKEMAVVVILDASGSMLKRENGMRRIQVAREALLTLIQEELPAGVPFALRVFGHLEADSCRSDLEIPLAPLQRGAAAERLNNINAMNLAKTPIARSLELVKDDLAGHEGSALIVLITDGEETCGGDPRVSIKTLADAGIRTRVNIVGFAIDEQGLKQNFSDWARLGNGRYFDATQADSLAKKLVAAVRTPFEVVNGEGRMMAKGEAGGEPITLPAGTYQLKYQTAAKELIKEVTIQPDEESVVNLD